VSRSICVKEAVLALVCASKCIGVSVEAFVAMDQKGTLEEEVEGVEGNGEAKDSRVGAESLLGSVLAGKDELASGVVH
jgi:hypothetical protein